MIDKLVLFKKVQMKDGKVESTNEVKGQIMDKFTDSREKAGKVTNTDYYLIADETGVMHQVRPFNVIQVLS